MSLKSFAEHLWVHLVISLLSVLCLYKIFRKNNSPLSNLFLSGCFVHDYISVNTTFFLPSHIMFKRLKISRHTESLLLIVMVRCFSEYINTDVNSMCVV